MKKSHIPNVLPDQSSRPLRYRRITEVIFERQIGHESKEREHPWQAEAWPQLKTVSTVWSIQTTQICPPPP